MLSACNVGNSEKNNDTADSNNDNSTNIYGDGERACSLCSSKQYLEENYDVESYINCTDYCQLPANGDPVKVQCDRDCIKDRLAIAKEDCTAELGCGDDEVVDAEIVDEDAKSIR